MDSDVSRVISISVAQALRRAIDLGYAESNRVLAAFASGMTVGARGDMEKIHVAVAREMRTAVRNAYDTTVEAERIVPAYKRYSRLSGGLGRAIRRNDLVRADPDGIHFINSDAMKTEAAHWKRLNFGAGNRAGAEEAAVPLRLFGETLAYLDFGIGPQAPFALPAGFFNQGGKAVMPNSSYRGGGSVGSFFPNRKSPYHPAMTEGIRGRHFLEVGLQVAAEELDRRYTQQVQDWIDAGGRKARAIAKSAGAL